MLHTLATGAVWSKPQSLRWALEMLDPRWRGLLERALALKKGDPRSSEPADPQDVAATRAFARSALEVAARLSPSA
jgi:hypothetical protein